MQFEDEGYIVGARRYGESSLIVDVVSKNHGLLAGFVKGGGGKKNLAVYQTGNKISFFAYRQIKLNQFRFYLKFYQGSR